MNSGCSFVKHVNTRYGVYLLGQTQDVDISEVQSHGPAGPLSTGELSSELCCLVRQRGGVREILGLQRLLRQAHEAPRRIVLTLEIRAELGVVDPVQVAGRL